MKMVDFIEIYFRDKNGEVKDRTKKNKRYIFVTFLLLLY